MPVGQVPIPEGVSADVKYMAQVYEGGVRQILRDGQKTRAMLRGQARRVPVGPVARLFAAFEKWPGPVQNALSVMAALIVLQLVGAAFQKITGQAPPQVTVPTHVQGGSITIDQMDTP